MITSSISPGSMSGPVDQRLERDRGQIDGMDVLELPVPLGDRRPDRIDDDSIGH